MRDVSDLIARRRLELTLSRRELADRVGCRVGAVQALEQGGDLTNWPLRLVQQLLQALGFTWSDLDTGPASAVNPTEVERLGAEIVRTGRLRDVDLQAAAASEALSTLRQQLEGVGMTIAEARTGTFVLAAREDVPPLPRTFCEVSDRLEHGALTGPEEDVISAIVRGSLDRQRLSDSRSRALASLLRAGLVEDREGKVVPAGPLETALRLHGPADGGSVPAVLPDE